jgi:DNA (cytosine-5)-methyltransferase 1
MTPLTVGSLFSGMGCFDHGLERAGWKTLWLCEKDDKARLALAKHWPGVPLYDDVAALDGKTLPPVTLIVGGFPCQDLSCAGRQGGLKGGTRSGLFFQMIRVIDEVRPAFVIWENVPGLLSGHDGEEDSDEGDDAAGHLDGGAADAAAEGSVPWMSTVLGEFSEIGYDGCWRVLDGRHFGVPQRRRRVFGLFARVRAGDAGGLPGAAPGIDAGRLAGVPLRVLLERQGVRGHPVAGGAAGPDAAAPAGPGAAAGGRERKARRPGG